MSVARDGFAPCTSAGSVNSMAPTEPMPVTVTPGEITWLSPRSASLPRPCDSRTLPGLMSRCTMPASCSACAARAASATAVITIARLGGGAPSAGRASEPSVRYSMA